METEFNDSSIMPFGKHQGKQMQDVPLDYLKWYLENSKYGCRNMLVIRYARQKIEK